VACTVLGLCDCLRSHLTRLVIFALCRYSINTLEAAGSEHMSRSCRVGHSSSSCSSNSAQSRPETCDQLMQRYKQLLRCANGCADRMLQQARCTPPALQRHSSFQLYLMSRHDTSADAAAFATAQRRKWVCRNSQRARMNIRPRWTPQVRQPAAAGCHWLMPA
jgi:hypothetical protein